MKSKAQFKETFDTYVDNLGQKLLAFNWEDESAYAGWLAQTYFFVKHTTTLICLTGALFGTKDRKRHYDVIHHLSDEKGHDLLALNDLTHLGWKPESWPELRETQLFYQNQYYMLEHEGPHSHLGYSLCLEGLAAKYGVELYQRLKREYGEDACQFIKVHAEVDQDHYASGSKLLNDLNEEQLATVERNLKQSSLLYGLMLDEITNQCARVRTNKDLNQSAAA